jgi:uncharacterized membrane protein YfcA
MAVFSGIAGGGAGFVTTPLQILLGLTPAQAVSTGKLTGLGIVVDSLRGMHERKGRVSKRRVLQVMVLVLGIGLLAPFVIRSLDAQFYRILLGVVILLMVPVVIIKKVGQFAHQPSRNKRFLGAGLLAVALLLQGIFGGGLGTLVNVVLMGLLGMTATDANITKRWSQLILNVTIVIGVVLSHLIVWQLVLVGMPVTLIGGYLGGKLAVRNGNQFVINVMVTLMVISGLALIFGVEG